MTWPIVIREALGCCRQTILRSPIAKRKLINCDRILTILVFGCIERYRLAVAASEGDVLCLLDLVVNLYHYFVSPSFSSDVFHQNTDFRYFLGFYHGRSYF